MYIDHVLHKYGTGATVIFDGYTGEPSTKDTTHLRRSKGQIGKTVKFTGNMILNANKKPSWEMLQISKGLLRC